MHHQVLFSQFSKDRALATIFNALPSNSTFLRLLLLCRLLHVANASIIFLMSDQVGLQELSLACMVVPMGAIAPIPVDIKTSIVIPSTIPLI